MNRDENICWFHEDLNREDAEDLIKKEALEDGTFLIRRSSTATGDYVLTLLYKGEVVHYQIRRHGEDAFFSIDDKIRILHGLDSLVEFYKEDNHGLVTKLSNFIKKDPPPNNTRSHGVTNLLHRATKQNEKTVITELLKCGYRNTEAKNQYGQTALHLACIYCDEDVLKLFIDANVAINVMDGTGNLPLHYACQRKSSSFIRMLLEANAQIHGRNINNGYVPLHEAAKNGNLQAVKILLSSYAPLLPRTKLGEFPIDLAKEENHTEVVEYLNNYKIAPSKTCKEDWYHGTLTREEAIEVLKKFISNMKDVAREGISFHEEIDTSGCFLVRFSEKNKSSGYVLTLLWNGQIKHYQIGQSSKYLFIDEGPYLPSLEHLVEHFMRFADGLPVNLKYPVRPTPKPPLPTARPIRSKIDEVAGCPIGPSPINISFSNRSGNIKQYASQTLGNRKKNATLDFNTLKISNVRKHKFEMSSLRKCRSKGNKDESLGRTDKKMLPDPNVCSFLKEISFSTNFDKPIEIYNVPQNNAAVVYPMYRDTKTEAEIEYFTKSDVAIERERIASIEKIADSSQHIYDIKKTNSSNSSTRRLSNENLTIACNGYTPTMDARIFTKTIPGNQSQYEINKCFENLELSSSTNNDIKYCFSQENNVANLPTEIVPFYQLNYFIDRDRLELKDIIGRGEFGEVYQGNLLRFYGKNCDDNISKTCYQVAVKTLSNELCRSNKEDFLREASVMFRLHHHCIVQLIGISKGETWMMVQELVSLGSMLQYIIDNRCNIKPNYELKLWASQIACGMEYLESQHYVHRDLAARNILLASRNQAKISDFGLSRALDYGNDCYQATQGGKWPIKWYAPESFNNGIFSHASDVWSFGITLWEMFSFGEAPYGDIRGVDVIKLIDNGERLSQPIKCPGHVYEIMKNCWNYKPKDRPSFRFLREFFASDPDYQNICELIKTQNIS